MTTVVISQPMYLPWPGFISQMAMADVLIWLDDAQFSRGSFTNRVQIRTSGGSKWLSVPLVGKGVDAPIRCLAAARTDWHRAHRDLVRQALRNSPFLQEALSILDMSATSDTLCAALVKSAELCLAACHPPRSDIRQASEMNVPGASWRRVLDLVHTVGGTRYLTGHGAANYLNHAAFEAEGVTVDYMGYEFLPWPQQHGDFSPYVTSLDLIANVPPEHRTAHLSRTTLPWRDFLAAKGIAVSD
ncbi:WbqC family protein [Rhodobacter sp. HX-7-19]|uniref:WbqC family protein n=1 Tax=Paragemmobacter kunshanensis TaxID=2583234 RepID=A0A6M1TU65_9RHOB|nr:WbqC family protein [Rhodobacter kunshanensis]NGQ89452.1 WbqC family protein [Rhodobacter kunshanensis]